MTYRNTDSIIKACDHIARVCTTIGGGWHGSAWLFDKVMRAFDHKAVEAVTYECYLNAPVMRAGEVTIHRDGHYEIRRAV